jgi:hypothetical protein
MRPSWTVVLPTNRPESVEPWFDAWKPLFEKYDATVVIMWDLAKVPQLASLKKCTKVQQYCWEDVDSMLGEDSWIIPKRTCDIRSFGMYLAWLQRTDYVLTLDDDVRPLNDLFYEYEKMFDQEVPSKSYFDTGDLLEGPSGEGVYCRGFPQRDKHPRKVIAQFGGWNGCPDLDGYVQVGYQEPYFNFLPQNVNIQRGVGFSGCSMNVALRREAIVWWYQLLMGQDWPYDRFGDMWSGLFLKRLCDLHKYPIVFNGKASVEHNRASNPVTNMKKEASGLVVNEYLWDSLQNFGTNYMDPVDDYEQRAQFIKENELFPKEYNTKLCEAMMLWANLFKEE